MGDRRSEMRKLCRGRRSADNSDDTEVIPLPEACRYTEQ